MFDFIDRRTRRVEEQPRGLQAGVHVEEPQWKEGFQPPPRLSLGTQLTALKCHWLLVRFTVATVGSLP